MKNPKLWIWLGVASFILLVAVAFAPRAFATNKPPSKPPVVIVEKERDYSAALIGAGITAWIMHRRAKRQRPEPLVVVPPTCPAEEKLERVLELCGK